LAIRIHKLLLVIYIAREAGALLEVEIVLVRRGNISALRAIMCGQ